MPIEQEISERAKIERRHPDWSERRKDAYVYAVLRARGWKPRREREAKEQ